MVKNILWLEWYEEEPETNCVSKNGETTEFCSCRRGRNVCVCVNYILKTKFVDQKENSQYPEGDYGENPKATLYSSYDNSQLDRVSRYTLFQVTQLFCSESLQGPSPRVL